MKRNTLNRRALVGAAAAGVASSALPPSARAQFPSPGEGTLRDRLWLFANPINSTFPHTGRRSVMSPAEGAFYMGIPNIIMIQANAGDPRHVLHHLARAPACRAGPRRPGPARQAGPTLVSPAKISS